MKTTRHATLPQQELCDLVQLLLSKHAFDPLSHEALDRVATHLQGCEECSAYADRAAESSWGQRPVLMT
jgi:predicted anti-sigma-YlaC factor YlaD